MFRSFPRKRESSSMLLASGSPLSRGRAEMGSDQSRREHALVPRFRQPNCLDLPGLKEDVVPGAMRFAGRWLVGKFCAELASVWQIAQPLKSALFASS